MFKNQVNSPENEEQRLLALYTYDILGDSLELELDNLVKLAAQIANVPMAYVSFVDREHVILKSAIGIDPQFRKLPRAVAICPYTMFYDNIFVVPDVTLNPDLADNPVLKHGENIRFYASAPLKDADGYALGCLCLLDLVPRNLSGHQLEALETLAVQVIAQLALKKKNTQLEAQTKRAEEFINIFTVSPEIHCILNREGQILFINQAVTKLLEYSVEETLGRSMWEFCYNEDVHRTVGIIEQGLKNKVKQFSIDFRIISKNKHVKWIGWGMVAKADRWYCYGRDITETKRVEADLTRLSFVASKVNNGVVISDAKNRVSWVNDAFEKITGFDLKDLQGKQLGDLISGPETDWNLIENARKLTKEKKSFTVDILAYRKDKQKIWLSIYSTVVLTDDGQVGTEVEIIIDITEKKKAEEQLEVLSMVASKTNTGVAICNANGEITWVNKALERLIGYSLAELNGKLLGDVIANQDTDRDLIVNSRNKALNKESYTIEVFANKKDNHSIWLSVANTPIINSNGIVERQIELIADITQRKHVESEMMQAREQAMQLSEAKEMFLSVMSHEIRTPLNAVIGMTHLLLDNDPKASQLEDLNILKFSGENLLNIINDILDFTKIETGNLHLEYIPFNLQNLSSDIINSLQVNAVKKENVLKLHFDQEIPDLILGDKTRIYQILMNLLGNAIKFTDKGNVELLIKQKKQTKEFVEICFEVKDSGIGIPQDKQEYIFEAFTQAKTDISRKYGGTGLGLAITKKLLKLYDSNIDVKSTEGRGTIFSFDITFQKVTSAKIDHHKSTKVAVFTGKRILVVDDNEINTLIAKRIFSKWGLIIDFATNGHEAISMIMGNVYDLVFMDIKMPGIDGFEATSIIRELEGEYYKKLPIIALTASTLHNENSKFKESGMNGHILKPFNPDEIKNLLIDFLKK